MEYKSLKITEESHKILKEYCDDNYLKMNDWLSHVILTYIKELDESNKRKKMETNLP
jgi:hypothetical protein